MQGLAMRARVYGLMVLVLVGIVPLIAFGYVALLRSETTAINEVHNGNARLARTIADRIGDYTIAERRLLASIGAAILQIPDRSLGQALVETNALHYPHMHDVGVFTSEGRLWAGVPVASSHESLLRQALAGVSMRSELLPTDERSNGFAHKMVFAEPIVIAGKHSGAIIAKVDLVGIWPPVNSVRVGRTGYARLLSIDGQLLAHGDPEERRFVFVEDTSQDAALVAGAILGNIVQNQQGIEVVASIAFVSGFPWLVVVEQTVEEAFAGTAEMRRELLIFAVVALVSITLLGILLGRELVRGLEQLKAHTKILAKGALQTVFRPKTRLTEVRVLAQALNDMASSLKRLQDEAAAQERLTTFSRVAAGLAHDLRQPIESLRGAWDTFLGNSEDVTARDLLTTMATRDLQRLKRYVDDLSGLAKQGDIALSSERTCLFTLAEKVVQELRQRPKWKGVEFVVTGAEQECTVDINLVRRAVMNLAANGADACLEKEGKGTVAVEVRGWEKEQVKICVSDTGSGIEESRLSGLFRSDFRSTKRSSGVGLGLGVVRHVAEVHRGTLEVCSQVGVGSTFTLTLPCEGGALKGSSNRPIKVQGSLQRM